MDPRERLLEAALQTFARKSYEGTGIQEICDSAEVTKPTLYHHFGSKYGLLQNLVAFITAPLVKSLDDATDYSGDLPNTLAEATEAFFRFARNFPVEFRYFLSMRLAPESSESRKAVRILDDTITDNLVRLFRQTAKDHGNMRGRETMLAAGFLGTAYTFATLIAEGRLNLDDHLIHQAVHQFSHGIYS